MRKTLGVFVKSNNKKKKSESTTLTTTTTATMTTSTITADQEQTSCDDTYDPLIHTEEKKHTFLSSGDIPRSGKLSSVLVNGLHLDFIASGSFGRVESKKGGTIVKKTLIHVLPDKLTSKRFDAQHLDTEMTDGCKEVLVLRRINKEDPFGSYAPLLVGAKFDTYRNSTSEVTLVRELVMTNAGRSVSYWIIHKEALPIKLLLRQGLQALEFLHNCGVYHCDISSGNITYDRLDNRFKLIDFGQATFSFAPSSQDDRQPLKVIDTAIRQNAICAVNPEAFLSDSCKESNAVVHVLDSTPTKGFVLLGEQDLTTFSFRDISLVLADRFQRRVFNNRYDVYSLGMVLVEAMGFDIHNVPMINDFCYADLKSQEDERMQKLYKSNAVALCRKNTNFRGGLAFHELEFWKNFVNDDLRIVETLSEDEDKICDLDWAARIFGADVTETVKSMIHPIPEYRNFGGYSLVHCDEDELDGEDEELPPCFHVSIPTYYKKRLSSTLHSTIVVDALWAVPKGDFGEDRDDDDHDQRKSSWRSTPISYCRVGSVSFRRQLDLRPDRVYVERIYVQPRHRSILAWLLGRALQRSFGLFSPPLARDRSVDLIIFVANQTERDLIASSFPEHVVKQTDKYHVKINGWQVFDGDGSKAVGHDRV